MVPLFSLPGRFGCGDIESLHTFLDNLAQTEFRLVQFLPLNALSAGDPSPYSSLSAFACNPLFLSLERLPWLRKLPQELPTDEPIDWQRVYDIRMKALREAWKVFQEHPGGRQLVEFNIFRAEQGHWLEEWSLFAAIFTKQNKAFWDWPKKQRGPQWAYASMTDSLAKEADFQAFLQWLFFRQWREVRMHANQLGIQLMGDLPIYVSKNSADYWSRPEMFLKGVRAGVPPDLYSEEGQDWGNPIYDWELMEEEDFDWWRDRMGWLKQLYDCVRMDHIRGFHGFWAIEDGKKSKDTKEWTEGPGTPLIEALQDSGIGLIGEDLGYIPEDVQNWLQEFNIPGYRVSIFGWGYYASSDDYGGALRYRKPEEWPQNSYSTTSTHDSESLMEFLQALGSEDKKALIEDCGLPAGTQDSLLADSMLQRILKSPSLLSVFPLQDILKLPVRINTPGTVSPKNWTARIPLGEDEWNILKNFGASS